MKRTLKILKKFCKMANLNVLLVDDDSEESYLFNEVLEQANLDIHLSRADNGIDFLAMLNNNPLPDLVFMDINMPYKDGLEALDEIRKNQKFEKLPLIIYSNTRNEERINECFNKGANLFIVKPLDFEGMMLVVKRVFMTDWKTFPKPLRENFVIYNDQFVA